MRCSPLFGLLLLFAAPAAGQEGSAATVQQPRCWLGGMGYSPGATIRAGNAVMVCTPEFGWAPTSAWASGCVLEGRQFSVGAKYNLGSGTQPVLIACTKDGIWSTP
jgi:hypothetical protein